ncbi:MAG: hypothetical protein V1716_02075 [Candidatus Uhrbacteria bacterium]
MKIEFPLIAIHQLYVGELAKDQKGNGLYLPQWLFDKTHLIFGEKIILTREESPNRKGEAVRDRTTTPVFFWNKDHVCAVGPTATFLDLPGLSCLIAYGKSIEDNYLALDYNFPLNNKKNLEADLVAKVYGENKYEKVKENIDREVLLHCVSGLKVEVGDPFCNPHLAEVPGRVLEQAGIPNLILSAYFSSNSKSIPALKSYVAPSKDDQVAMSGALYSAINIGDVFSVDIYQSIKGEYINQPNFLDVSE